MLSRRWRTNAPSPAGGVYATTASANVSAQTRHRRRPQQVDINNYTSAAGGANNGDQTTDGVGMGAPRDASGQRPVTRPCGQRRLAAEI